MNLEDSGHSMARMIHAARLSGALNSTPPPLLPFPPAPLLPTPPPNLLPQPQPLFLYRHPAFNPIRPSPFQLQQQNHLRFPPPLLSNNTPSVLATQTSAHILSQIVNLSQPQRRYSSPYYPYEHHLTHAPAADDVFQVLLLYDTDDKINVQKYPIITRFQSLSIEQQLTSFFRSQNLSVDQMRIRWQIAFDMQHILRSYYTNCQVYVFGSLLTGLANDSSDVDMYADLFGDDGRLIQQQKCPDIAAADLRDETYSLILDNNTCPHSRGQGAFAKEMHVIGFARVPVLRFRHGPTGIKCDISFGSRISVQNSMLLSFYLKYDPCLGPLLVFLRYWGNFHAITGGIKIKQYALGLMALVYLMKKGTLPSVALLQSLEAEQRREHGIPLNLNHIEGWNASFCDNRARIDEVFTPASSPAVHMPGYPYTDPQHFMQLLLDFFEMYANLNMNEVVICPLRGAIVSRKDFMDQPMAKQQGEWGRLMRRNFGADKLLCIQDPFVLTFNVAEITRDGTVNTFQKMCDLTHQRMNPKRGNIRSILGFFTAAEPEDEYPALVKTG